MKTEKEIRQLAEKVLPIEGVDDSTQTFNYIAKFGFIKGYTACKNQMQEDVEMLRRYLQHLNEAYGDEWTLAEQVRFEDAMNNKDPFQNQPQKL